MRTSATGTTRLRGARSGRRRSGFTLIELLVVLVIFGIAAGVVTLRLLPDDARRARDEGEATALLLEQAAAEAESSGQLLAWVPAGDSSHFERPDGSGGWSAVADDPELARRPLPAGLRWGVLQFAAGSLARPAAASPGAAAGPDSGTSASGAKAPGQAAARVVFLPGQLAPAFDIALHGGSGGVLLHGTPLGTVRVGALQ